MLRERPSISTERPTCGNRSRSLRRPIVTAHMQCPREPRRLAVEGNTSERIEFCAYCGAACWLPPRPIGDNLNERFRDSRGGLRYNPALTSISTNASFVRRDTCTVERAGGADVKYLAYTS